jgi:phosphatidylserine/phosphatidylglycerophosphate/cardiolipin synthase-like enzyme
MSEELDLGATRATEGFFLTRDHDDDPFDVSASKDTAWSFCSTFRGSPRSLRRRVIDLIRHARRKVFVCSYILGDDELIEELINAAARLEGAVYAISAIDEDYLRVGLADLADHKGPVDRKVEAEKKRFLALTNRGVAMRGHNNFHAKFVVVDDEVAWVGSANLETLAFDRNGEIGVVVDDPLAVTTMTRLFARMWVAECGYELPAHTDTYRVSVRTPTAAGFTVPDPVPGTTAGIVWTDHGEPASVTSWRHDSLRLSIQDIIDRASCRLRLASMTLKMLDHRPDLILIPVARARSRGIQVDLLVRTRANNPLQRGQAQLFHDLGVRVVADTVNHAKAVIADDQHGALFSANLDVEHGLVPGKGLEIGARLDGQPALGDLVAYLDHALRCAPYEFVGTPTTRQLHDGLRARVQRWPDHEWIEVRGETVLWRQLMKAAEEGPTLWTVDGDRLRLHLGSTQIRVRRPADGCLYLEELEPAAQSSLEQLKQWLALGGDNSRERGPARAKPGMAARGLFPARLRYTEPSLATN